MFEKTSMSHHSLKKTLLTGSVSLLIQRIDVCCSFHQSHDDTRDGQFPRCLSKSDLGVDSKIVMNCVEHLVARVTAIWIHSNETRSSTMNKPVLQQRFLALRSLIVAGGAFTSFLKQR